MGLNTYAIEQAVSRTGAQDLGELRTMLAQVGKVYAGQIPAKDAALAAKEQTIATQDEMIAEPRRTHEQVLTSDALAIAELCRRAEQAEAERDRLAAAQAAPSAPGTPEAPTRNKDPSGVPSAGFWARVRRMFGVTGDKGRVRSRRDEPPTSGATPDVGAGGC